MSLNGSSTFIDVVVVEPDGDLRHEVAEALSGDDILVSAVCGWGREGARLAVELAPAVAIVGPQLPDMDGTELIRVVHREAPQVAILVLTADESEEFALHALRAGAAGVLSRRVGLDALPRIVRSLAAGEAVITRALSMRLVELLRVQPAAGRGMRPVRSDLSTREWEVLDLLCAGASTAGVAGTLGLATETVRSHVKRLLRKLGAHSRGEAIEYAVRALADCAPTAVRPGRPRSSP